MKNYYFECVVKYTDNDCEEGEEPFDGQEIYSLTVGAKTEESARKKAKKQVMEEFNEHINCDFDNVSFLIETCYETSEDARR